MVSGWRDGCALVASKPMSFIRRALQYRVSTAGLRRIVSTPRCSSASSWGGYVGSLGIACKMVAIPTLAEEDAKRPSRERESLVGERTRIINRMKAALIRLGICGFKP